jgi:hypothetical protein
VSAVAGPGARDTRAVTQAGDGTGDLRAMHRAVMKPDGARSLLGWLAARLGGSAVLLDRAGQPVLAAPGGPGEAVLRGAAEAVMRVVGGRCAAAAVDTPALRARVVRLGAAAGGPALLVTAAAPLSPEELTLVGDAAGLLHLWWQADLAGQRMRALGQAWPHIREAVLHLLMAGHVSGARRVATAVRPALADVVRVYITDGPAQARDQIAGLCEAACHGRAWVIPCPVYTRHVIVLAPVPPGEDLDTGLETALRTSTGAVAVGAGEPVPLAGTATGYEQAFHALAVARRDPARFARFSARTELAALLGPGARQWAREELAALLAYVPARPHDPDSGELLVTLRSWLDFGGGSARQLKLHRNTLTARIRHIQAVLGRDLGRLPAQAQTHLALRLLGPPAGPQDSLAVQCLDTLLAAPAARQWADAVLGPLSESPGPPLLVTVQAWLAADARPEAAAASLGVSARCVHRRLVRAEQRLGRSLLAGPSARYDLQLALRIRGQAASRRSSADKPGGLGVQSGPGPHAPDSPSLQEA